MSLRDAYFDARASEFVDHLPVKAATTMFDNATLTWLSGAEARFDQALLSWAAEDDRSLAEKIEILQGQRLYNICFRNAGVACMFATAAEDDPGWRKGLTVHRYYPDIEASVNAEIERLRNG